MRHITNARISADGGRTWHAIEHAWYELSYSYNAPPVPSEPIELASYLAEPISLTIHSTPTPPNPFYNCYAAARRIAATRWPAGARAEARRQRKRRAHARQKRQRRA